MLKKCVYGHPLPRFNRVDNHVDGRKSVHVCVWRGHKCPKGRIANGVGGNGFWWREFPVSAREYDGVIRDKSISSTTSLSLMNGKVNGKLDTKIPAIIYSSSWVDTLNYYPFPSINPNYINYTWPVHPFQNSHACMRSERIRVTISIRQP